MRRGSLLLVLALAPACATAPASPHPPVPESELARLKRQAAAVAPLVSAEWVRRFVAAAASLPDVEPRTLYHDAEKTRFLTALELSLLPEAERLRYAPQTFDAEYFYGETRWGSPLAYARALEVAEPAGFEPSGKRVFDFGYGSIAHLRMLASLGADARGVDVDPVLRALYAAGDQGSFGPGRVTVLSGRFPADAALVEAAGLGYDLVLSKNVLKRGYLHPERPADPKHLIQVGVSDEAFVQQIYRMLAPGGRFLIYNICPGPNRPDKPYVPWADGRSPFSQGALEAAGFQVLAFEQDDLPAVQAMARALEWDKDDPPMDLAHDLQAQFTLAERTGP